jgi:hypothetical protein
LSCNNFTKLQVMLLETVHFDTWHYKISYIFHIIHLNIMFIDNSNETNCLKSALLTFLNYVQGFFKTKIGCIAWLISSTRRLPYLLLKKFSQYYQFTILFNFPKISRQKVFELCEELSYAMKIIMLVSANRWLHNFSDKKLNISN